MLLTVSELDLTERNQPDSGTKTDQMQDMILFSSETTLQKTFSEAPVRKILARKKRYRGSPTELQIIFVLFALNLLWRTSLVLQPDYEAMQESPYVLYRN